MPLVKVIKTFTGPRYRNVNEGEILHVSDDMASAWIRNGLAEMHKAGRTTKDKMVRPANTPVKEPEVPEQNKQIEVQIPMKQNKEKPDKSEG